MARITVEDCLERENNRFALVRLASLRTKQIRRGSGALTKEGRGNKPVVVALREIADGLVRFLTPEEEVEYREQLAEEERERQKQAEMTPLMNTTVIPFQAGALKAPRLEEDEGDDAEEALPQLFGETKTASQESGDVVALNGSGRSDEDRGEGDFDD
jgi:DNA-directed RNA polymerase subunit omega